MNTEEEWVRKVGQIPPFQVDIPRNLNKLVSEHQELFKKGSISESHGFGIGAFAYYRRIVENVIDEMLDEIGSFVEPSSKAEYAEAIENAKKTRVAQEKIEVVKELLPITLRPGNVNPLAVLHSHLSAGIHARSDAECLESALLIRQSLLFVANQIKSFRESSAEYSDAMSQLLKQKESKEKEE